MIKHEQDQEKMVKENHHGGKGSIEIIPILTMMEMNEKVKVFSKIIINKDSSIGYHQHIDEYFP